MSNSNSRKARRTISQNVPAETGNLETRSVPPPRRGRTAIRCACRGRAGSRRDAVCRISHGAPLGTRGAVDSRQVNACSRFHAGIARRQDAQAFRPAWKGRSAEFLGDVVRTLQDRDAVARRNAEPVRRVRGCRWLASRWTIQAKTRLPSSPKIWASTIPCLLGKEAVGDAYGGVPALPETFFIGRDGKIVDQIIGLKGRRPRSKTPSRRP